MDTQQRYSDARDRLEAVQQDQLLRYWDELDSAERLTLLEQIESVVWEEVAPLVESHVLQRPEEQVPTGLSPALVLPKTPRSPDEQRLYSRAMERGEEILRQGKVAAFTVAGGQGTRLGIDGPKGAVPVTPVRGKSLFGFFAEGIAAARERYEADLGWSILTSPANHHQTVEFFKEHNFFGLPPAAVTFFSQALLPTFDTRGKALLAEKYSLSLAPDGHGGSLKALVRSGTLDSLRQRGVDFVSYFHVDNPLVRPFDPLFLGLHDLEGAEMSVKVVSKADDLERVGNVCIADGKTHAVEYPDFPEELARRTHPDGRRAFDAGSIGIHVLSLEFIARIVAESFELPYHRADKAIPFLDDDGHRQRPTKPNGVKLETFVFDALPLARHTVVLEVERAEEFAPVKNPIGVDSKESSIELQVERAARWLETAGVKVPRNPDGLSDVRLEIAPRLAASAAELKARLQKPPTLERGQEYYLE